MGDHLQWVLQINLKNQMLKVRKFIHNKLIIEKVCLNSRETISSKKSPAPWKKRSLEKLRLGWGGGGVGDCNPVHRHNNGELFARKLPRRELSPWCHLQKENLLTHQSSEQFLFLFLNLFAAKISKSTSLLNI
jgi:hypothetical protein